MQLNFIINFLSLDTKLVTSAVYMESFASEYFFLIQLFSDLISKVFAYKIAWYHEVFPIISLQPCVTNLLFLKGYLESTSSKLKQERDREKDRDRERQRQKDRDRDRDRERQREKEKEKERERDEKAGMTRKVFWKITFFQIQPAKSLNLLRSLALQSLWVKKWLVTSHSTAMECL